MIHILLSVIGIFLTICFIVGTHEWAHFQMARWCKVKVLRFSIGFGKALLKWRDKKGTEYIFALIPLGGYVQMLGEGTEEGVTKEEKKFAYNNQPFYKKFLIVAAGPAMNFLCAIVLYWFIYMIGFMSVKPVIGAVDANSIAAKAGMRANHQIIKVDNEKTPTWISVIFKLLIHTGNQDKLTITTVQGDNPGLNHYTLNLTNWKMNELSPDPLTSLGLKPYSPPVALTIGLIQPDSPAAVAGLKLKDKLIAVNGHKIKDWEYLIKTVRKQPGETIQLTVKRNGSTKTIPIKIAKQYHWFSKNTGHLGIGPRVEMPKDMLQKIQYNPIRAIPYAFGEAWQITHFNIILFGKMITGKLSMDSLGGPITIFDSAGNALNSGWISFMSFLAFLSVSIGIINLFPIPGLDGFHLVVQVVETIIRRPIPNGVLFIAYRVGVAAIFIILIRAVMNDVMRLM